MPQPAQPDVKCKMGAVKKETIEAKVISEIKKYVFTENSAIKIAEEMQKNIEQFLKDSPQEDKKLVYELKKTNKEIDNIITAH